MVRDDDIDRRAWLRAQPSGGPAWDAAIDFGIDVTLIEDNLARTMAERFAESLRLTRFAASVDAARERLYGACLWSSSCAPFGSGSSRSRGEGRLRRCRVVDCVDSSCGSRARERRRCILRSDIRRKKAPWRGLSTF